MTQFGVCIGHMPNLCIRMEELLPHLIQTCTEYEKNTSISHQSKFIFHLVNVIFSTAFSYHGDG